MRKTIVFDFDGVIHEGYEGWKDGSIYGNINYKLLDFMKELLQGYYVVISSCRPAEQIVNFMNELNYNNLKFEKYDDLYWNNKNVIGVTNRKAVGILYIDDRAYRYDAKKDVRDNIENIFAVLIKQEILGR